MKSIWGYLKTQKLFWLAIILPAGLIAFTWFQITSKPYISPGDPGCATLDAYLATTPSNATILVSDTQTLTTHRTVPASCTLKIINPGMVVIPDSGDPATPTRFAINGGLEAGDYKIFNCVGSSRVQFGPYTSARSGVSVGISEYKIRWWGAVGDGVTDDTAAVQAALSAAYHEGGNMQPRHATIVGTPYDAYAVTTVNINDTTGNYPGQLILDGKGATFKKLGVENTPVIYITSSGVRVRIKNWTFVGSCDYVYNHELASKPTLVRFQDLSGDWHTGNEILTNQSDCIAPTYGLLNRYDWFWETGVSLTGETLTVVKSANTIARTVAGDFVADGLKAGDLITTSGFADAENNGLFRIHSVAANLLTLTTILDSTSVLKNVTGDAGCAITRLGKIHVNGSLASTAYLPSDPNLKYQAVEVTGAAYGPDLITTWGYSLYGCAVKNYCTGYFSIDNCSIKNFDIGVMIRGGEWNQVSNTDFSAVNCACYSVSDAGSICTNNLWQNISIHMCHGDNPAYPFAFWLQDEAATLTSIDIEMTRAGMIFKGGPGLNVQGLYIEGTCYYNNSVAQDAIYLNQVTGAKISGATMATGMAGAYTSSLVNMFHFKDAKGADITGNWLYPGPGVYIYKYEESAALAGPHEGGGITFKNNAVYFSSDHLFSNGPPVVKFEDNWFDPSTYYMCQPSMVTLSTIGVPEHSTLAAWTAYFSSSATTPLVPYVHDPASLDGMPTKDTTAGFTDTNSLKLVYISGNTAVNETQFLHIGTRPASGTWTKLTIFAVKSDAALNLIMGGSTIPLLGDDVWRVVYLMQDAAVCDGSTFDTGFKSSAAGNVWIDDFTVKFFSTKQEAMAYVGKWDIGAVR